MIRRTIRRALEARYTPPLLREGETAPEWSLRGHDGALYGPGEHWSLLVFYPGDGTTTCAAQLHDIEANRATLESLDVRPYGINPAGAASHAAFAERERLGFPLLVDEGAVVARRFHAWFQPPAGRARVIRTVYLVNPARKIRLANRGSPSVAAIVRSVQALQHATRAGM